MKLTLLKSLSSIMNGPIQVLHSILHGIATLLVVRSLLDLIRLDLLVWFNSHICMCYRMDIYTPIDNIVVHKVSCTLVSPEC